jgi:hypothetical protein
VPALLRGQLVVGLSAVFRGQLEVALPAVFGSQLVVGLSAVFGSQLVVGLPAIFRGQLEVALAAVLGCKLEVALSAIFRGQLEVALAAVLGCKLEVGLSAVFRGQLDRGTAILGRSLYVRRAERFGLCARSANRCDNRAERASSHNRTGNPLHNECLQPGTTRRQNLLLRPSRLFFTLGDRLKHAIGANVNQVALPGGRREGDGGKARATRGRRR